MFTASDFSSVEVWTASGLVGYYLLFVIGLAVCVAQIVGITMRPDVSWMMQVSRNPIAGLDGGLASKRYLIVDRGTKFSQPFRKRLQDSGTAVIRLPPYSPNLNGFAERFVRSIKGECLARMIFVGLASLRRATGEYMAHNHSKRRHQGFSDVLTRR